MILAKIHVKCGNLISENTINKYIKYYNRYKQNIALESLIVINRVLA